MHVAFLLIFARLVGARSSCPQDGSAPADGVSHDVHKRFSPPGARNVLV